MFRYSADADALAIFRRGAHLPSVGVIFESVLPITQMSEIPSISLESAVHACKSWAIELRLFVSDACPGPDCEAFFREQQQGLAVVAARPCGASSRSRTARVTVRLHDGSLKDYFLRVSGSISL